MNEETKVVEIIKRIMGELENPDTSQVRKWELGGYLEYLGRRITEINTQRR